jgi:hypothetical protein
MTAGAEGKAGVEAQVNAIGIWWLDPAWTDPQALSAFDWREILLPLLRPVFIFKLFPAG